MTTGFHFLFFLLLAQPQPVLTGADRLFEAEYLPWIADKRVGLITNQTGVDRSLVSTIELLDNHPRVRLTALFAPEHGLEGSLQAGEEVTSEKRVHSLYGSTRAPTPDMLSDVDVLVYDIQDVGARFYTFISTLFHSMKAAGDAKIPLIVLDRPVPIRGDRVEGPLVEPGFHSFVGIHSVPIQYGMTPGELAALFNAEAELGCDLKVVPLQGWSRDRWFDETGLTWILPSPNMPTLQTATVYPGFCLIEGTNLSEGRGTTRPFELIGAPWLNSPELARRLNRLQLPGVRFRPQAFTPTSSKYSGESCRGLQVHVTDRNTFRAIPVAVQFLVEVRRLHPQDFQILPRLDRLAGNSWVRERLNAGDGAEAIIKRWQDPLEGFKARRRPHLIYGPLEGAGGR